MGDVWLSLVRWAAPNHHVHSRFRVILCEARRFATEGEPELNKLMPHEEPAHGRAARPSISDGSAFRLPAKMGFEAYQVTESGLDGSPDSLAATAGFVQTVETIRRVMERVDRANEETVDVTSQPVLLGSHRMKGRDGVTGVSGAARLFGK